MRAYLPAYEIVAPPTLDAILEKLDHEPGVWRPFAGGTDLMVLFEAGKLKHKKFVSLWHIDELHGICEQRDFLHIGALATYSKIQNHPLVQKEFALLVASARETGAVAIQNRGTLGGNIANASPAADSPPALLVYDAEIELAARAGRRWIRAHEFFVDYKVTQLRENEIVTQVRLPRAGDKKFHFYRKVGTRKAQAISKVCFAGVASLSKGRGVQQMAIALGSVAPTTLRCVQTENYLNGKSLTDDVIAQAKTVLAQEISPIDDIRSTGVYRVEVSQNLLEQFLLELKAYVPVD